jgi:hypothetical protein
MANRHVMIPEDIWRGLLLQNKSGGSNSPYTGDINLDYSRRSLDATRKNIPYNQQLRRYLHLRKQHENRPVKVEVVSGPNAAIPIRNNAMPSASMLSGLDNDDGDDGGDDQWIDDNMSFLSFNSLPSQVAPPSSPSRPVPRQLTKRRGDDEDAQSTGPPGPKKAKIQQPRPLQRMRRRQQKQRKPKQKRQKKQQQQQQNIQAQNLQEALRSDLADEDADPGPSTSAAAYGPPQPIAPPPPPPTRKGIKRRPLLSMRPPPFLHPRKRQKPNPPNRQKRTEPLAAPPPRKQFRPALW